MKLQASETRAFSLLLFRWIILLWKVTALTSVRWRFRPVNVGYCFKLQYYLVVIWLFMIHDIYDVWWWRYVKYHDNQQIQFSASRLCVIDFYQSRADYKLFIGAKLDNLCLDDLVLTKPCSCWVVTWARGFCLCWGYIVLQRLNKQTKNRKTLCWKNSNQIFSFIFNNLWLVRLLPISVTTLSQTNRSARLF